MTGKCFPIDVLEYLVLHFYSKHFCTSKLEQSNILNYIVVYELALAIYHLLNCVTVAYTKELGFNNPSKVQCSLKLIVEIVVCAEST